MGYELEGQQVEFFCRWPFDRYEDDFIEISNNFPLNRYRAGIRRLAEKKQAVIRACKFGELGLKVKSRGKIELDVADSSKTYFFIISSLLLRRILRIFFLHPDGRDPLPDDTASQRSVFM